MASGYILETSLDEKTIVGTYEDCAAYLTKIAQNISCKIEIKFSNDDYFENAEEIFNWKYKRGKTGATKFIIQATGDDAEFWAKQYLSNILGFFENNIATAEITLPNGLGMCYGNYTRHFLAKRAKKYSGTILIGPIKSSGNRYANLCEITQLSKWNSDLDSNGVAIRIVTVGPDAHDMCKSFIRSITRFSRNYVYSTNAYLAQESGLLSGTFARRCLLLKARCYKDDIYIKMSADGFCYDAKNEYTYHIDDRTGVHMVICAAGSHAKLAANDFSSFINSYRVEVHKDELLLTNRLGLNNYVSDPIIKCAKNFECDILLKNIDSNSGKYYDAKDSYTYRWQSFPYNTMIEIKGFGPNATDAVNQIRRCISSINEITFQSSFTVRNRLVLFIHAKEIVACIKEYECTMAFEDQDRPGILIDANDVQSYSVFDSIGEIRLVIIVSGNRSGDLLNEIINKILSYSIEAAERNVIIGNPFGLDADTIKLIISYANDKRSRFDLFSSSDKSKKYDPKDQLSVGQFSRHFSQCNDLILRGYGEYCEQETKALSELITNIDTSTYSREVTVLCNLGVHARIASIIVHIASKSKFAVAISKVDSDWNWHCDAKSIMAVMMLAAAIGSNVRVGTKAIDKAEAENIVDSIANILSNSDL